MIRVAILTISDSVVAGTREDGSGPALEEKVLSLGWNVVHKKTLPDETDQIAAEMSDLVDRADVILTTGGTGLGPRDVTPEATREIAHREIPGFGELMRAEW